jgi:hypothetical protein
MLDAHGREAAVDAAGPGAAGEFDWGAAALRAALGDGSDARARLSRASRAMSGLRDAFAGGFVSAEAARRGEFDDLQAYALDRYEGGELSGARSPDELDACGDPLASAAVAAVSREAGCTGPDDALARLDAMAGRLEAALDATPEPGKRPAATGP